MTLYGDCSQRVQPIKSHHSALTNVCHASCTTSMEYISDRSTASSFLNRAVCWFGVHFQKRYFLEVLMNPLTSPSENISKFNATLDILKLSSIFFWLRPRHYGCYNSQISPHNSCPKITALAKIPSTLALQNSIFYLQYSSDLSTLLHSPITHHTTARVYSLVIISFYISSSSLILSGVLQPLHSLCRTSSLERTPSRLPSVCSSS